MLDGKQQAEEELENADPSPGIDPDEDESIIQPFDPELIRVETRPMTIDLLLQRIKYAELNLTPDFQRKDGIWNPRTKSRLIESILIRIPLPAFYMDATDEDKWVVIDGLQRLGDFRERRYQIKRGESGHPTWVTKDCVLIYSPPLSSLTWRVRSLFGKPADSTEQGDEDLSRSCFVPKPAS